MPARITKETLAVRHEYTQDEKVALGMELAGAYSQLAGIEEEEKAVKAQFKERSTAVDSRIGTLSRTMQQGFEIQNIPCILRYDEPNVGEVSYYDPGGNLVKTRAMTDTERQLELNLEDQTQNEAQVQKSIDRSVENIKKFIPGSKTKKDAADGDPEGQCKNCELWFPASVLKTTDVDFHDLCPACWDQCVEEPKRQAAEPAQEAPPTQADGTEPPEGEAPPADPEAGPELNF